MSVFCKTRPPPRGSSTFNHLFLPSSSTSSTSLHFGQTLHAYLYGITETPSSSPYTGTTLTWLSYILPDPRQSSPGARSRSCTHLPKILRPSTSPIFKIITPHLPYYSPPLQEHTTTTPCLFSARPAPAISSSYFNIFSSSHLLLQDYR